MGRLVQSKTTIWLDMDDDNMIFAREDSGVMITVQGMEHGWDIVLDRNTFHDLRKAMDSAEREEEPSVRSAPT